MNPRLIAFLKALALVLVAVILLAFFPAALGFVEGAARNLARLWWLILLLALACWLIWGLGRKRG